MECPDCHGEGEVTIPASLEQPEEYAPCTTCRGEGEVPKEWQEGRDPDVPTAHCDVCGYEGPVSYLPTYYGNVPVCLKCFPDWQKYYGPEAEPEPEYFTMADVFFELATDR